MPLYQALVLGIIQGLTEFLPISSTGHLQIAPFIFGWDTPSVAFDVAVHVGTLVAVLYVFRETVLDVLRTIVGWRDASDADKRLVRMLVVGTIPAVVIAIAFTTTIEDTFQRPVLISLLLGVTGYFLLGSETVADHREEKAAAEGGAPPRSLDEIKDVDAAVIGLAQAASIFPGISRSGATIGAAMRLGISRRAAAAFSFLLSIPAIAGGAIFEIPDMTKEAGGGAAGAFIVGALASAVTGVFAIRWFLGIIQRRGLRPFGVYLFLLMIAGFLTALARG